MKASFFEGEFGAEITLIPETLEEVAAILRMNLNAKAVKPTIRTYLSKEPSCSVWLPSVKKTARRTTISKVKL